MSTLLHDANGFAGKKTRNRPRGKGRQGREWSGGAEAAGDEHGPSKGQGKVHKGQKGQKGQGKQQGKGQGKEQRTEQGEGQVREQGEKEGNRERAELPDLTPHLVKCGVYEEYKRWREGYRRWREGEADGASGEGSVCNATTEGPLRLSQSWRDDYRSWRAGGLKGARGEMQAHGMRCAALPPIIFDAVAGPGGEVAFLPSDGPPIAPILVQDFPAEALLTTRVFRFFEDRCDETSAWEKGLHNVNSGSIFWLPWHLEPMMHSTAGAKYGTWFTIHYVQVYAKHFKSAYHMCNEGYSSGAKTFGSTNANLRAISGKAISEGYFWYVSPSAGKEHLREEGWQHLDRAGPFDGSTFLKMWHERGSSLDVRVLQDILAKLMDESKEKRLT